jgi:hypothetical protein
VATGATVGAGAEVDAALVGGAAVAVGAGAGVGVDVDVAAEQARLAITNTPTTVASSCDRDMESSLTLQNDTLS